MKFCGHCGRQLIPEARFCVSCGTAAVEGTTSSASAAAGPGQAGGGAPVALAAAPVTATATATAPVPPEAKAASAFAGVPVSDYVRDGIAALALVMSLFMVWVYGGDNSTAGTRVDVILITLVSVLSLGISYLWRAGVFGPSVGYRKIQDLKLLANAPYVLLVLVYLALHLITAETSGSSAVDALGPAVAFGLGGALLAAQPRRGDIAPGQVDQPRNRRWIYVTLGVAGLAAVAALVQIIRYWVALGDADMAGWGILATLMALASPAVLVFIALQVNRRSDGWRSVGVALALGAGFLSLLVLAEDMTLLRLDLHAFGPDFSLIFWMGFGAAVSAPSVARLTEASVAPPAARRTALLPFLVLAGGLSALLTVGAVIALIAKATNDFSQSSIIPQVIAVLFGLLLTAGAVAAMRLTAKDPRSVYILASGYAGLSFVLGLVLMIVWAVQDEMTMGAVIMLLTFVLPAAILAVLWLPAASRAHFRSLPAHGTGASGFAFAGTPTAPPAGQGTTTTAPAAAAAPYVPAAAVAAETPAVTVSEMPAAVPMVSETPEASEMPATTAIPAVAETSAVAETPADAAATAVAETPDARETDAVADDAVVDSAPDSAPDAAVVDSAPDVTGVGHGLLAEAANPGTALVRLQELAADHPQTRPAIAANPATYPGLLAWLGQLGDPAVDAALRQRG